MNNRRKQLMLASAREYCKCVVEGKTIKYNQIANILNDSGTYYGMSYSSNTNGTITISGTSNYTGGDSNIYTIIANFTQKAGHKLLCYSTSSIFQILLYDNHGNYIDSERQYAYIVQCQYDDDMYASIMPYDIGLISNGATINETFKVMIIDLTELGLDNVNSVADFYETDLGKYIAKGNYLSATNGAFIQANTPINFKGINIWNEHWENGIWYEGNFYSSGYEDFICSVDMIKVKPNKEYFYFNNSSNTDCYIVYEMYDKDKNYISRDYCENKHSFRTTNDCEYVLFYVNDKYGNKYNYDICISENIWNEKYDNGYYASGTKTFVSDSGWICSKSEIKVKPNTKYYFSCSYYNVIYFFNNDTYIDSVICSNNSFTTPNNCNNIVFMTNTSTYNNDIGIFYYGYQKYCDNSVFESGLTLYKGDKYKTYGIDEINYNNLIPNANQDYINSDTDNANTNAIVYGANGGAYWAENLESLGFYSGTFESNTTELVNIYMSGNNTNLYFVTDIQMTSGHKYYISFNVLQNDASIVGGLRIANLRLIDLTELGLTDLTDKLRIFLQKNYKLPYTMTNKTIKDQIVRTFKEVDLSSFTWGNAVGVYYVALPKDIKISGQAITEKYANDDIWIAEYPYDDMNLIVRTNVTPSGKALLELATPQIMVWKEVEIADYHEWIATEYYDIWKLTRDYSEYKPINIDADIGTKRANLNRLDDVGENNDYCLQGNHIYVKTDDIQNVWAFSLLCSALPDIMISRRIINVESKNGIDLDFSKE